MSSFLGHSLAGLSVALRRKSFKKLAWLVDEWQWTIWLIALALIPDVDYDIPFLNPQSHEGLRITHSILFSSLLPCLTILFLLRYRQGQKIIFISGLELFLASVSHIFLDLLVDVTPIPLLWPMSIYEFKLPFGVLPSAEKISLTNYYFYSHLGIEMGILIPCSILLYLSNLRAKTLFSWS